MPIQVISSGISVVLATVGIILCTLYLFFAADESIWDSEAVSVQQHITVKMPAGFDKLIPPINFAPVENGVYRSGQPSAINLDFLRELKLNTIVWLGTLSPCQNNFSLHDQKLTLLLLGK